MNPLFFVALIPLLLVPYAVAQTDNTNQTVCSITDVTNCRTVPNDVNMTVVYKNGQNFEVCTNTTSGVKWLCP